MDFHMMSFSVHVDSRHIFLALGMVWSIYSQRKLLVRILDMNKINTLLCVFLVATIAVAQQVSAENPHLYSLPVEIAEGKV